MIILDKDLCLSGGANGADLAFGDAAIKAGHGLIHWSFSTHKPKRQRENVVILPQSELVSADEFVSIANNYLRRTFPTSKEHVNNLLRRNWFQIRDASSCYAVSEIKNGMVMGGTAWATAMFMAKHELKACPCYVYCQVASSWYQWSGTSWDALLTPPKPSDIYAGIGSRKLDTNGAQAIIDIYNQ